MIDRYTRPAMAQLWSEENKFAVWLDIEILVSEKLAQMGIIPRGVPSRMRKRARFDVERIERIEAETRHDVIAFLKDVGRHLGDDEQYLHYGLTSSDVVDTALAVRMVQAGDLLLQALNPPIRRTAALARRYIDTPIAGRTHGVFAEPTALGLKFALWHADLKRGRRRLRSAIYGIAVGKLSGAVGNFAHLDPRVEAYVCRKLGLRPAPISTQVLQRDRHAEYIFAVAALGATIEKIAQEIRLLHRTETGELTEGFASGQRGSSAMPHKQNPITCERLCGLARVLRGYVIPALENVALWHERDITHSSAERVVIADATTLLDYMLGLLDYVLGTLGVHPDRMLENLRRLGSEMFSQRLLLALAEGLGSRDQAYAIVQRIALERKGQTTFEDRVRADQIVRRHLAERQLDSVFDLRPYLRRSRLILKRALAQS
ncbi:MAG: adenylosuccinate lyase [candidate division Zixibacteria bacterium]|nr:adenylosuccinate lyase [candidate division Zixibacteria bacterium]